MAIGDVIRLRHSVKAFAAKTVPQDVLADVLHLMQVRCYMEILKLTLMMDVVDSGLCIQRAPSSMNMQPYVTIVLRDQADRDRLAGAMLESNGAKVKNAPVVVVFASDLGKCMAKCRYCLHLLDYA